MDKSIHHHQPLVFPAGFAWGAATSSHQVEGNNHLNDWWRFEEQGKTESQERSGLAVDQWHRYEEDFDLAKKLHHNAHRLSIEWSRIEPQPGVWDQQAIEHYRAVLQALKKRGLKVMLTLHHFTNPLWLADQGGWANPEAPRYFARYVSLVAEQLGEYVDWWITINEPLIYLYQGYVLGDWPPGIKDGLWLRFKVFRHLAKAHRLAYRCLHEKSKSCGREAKVGIAHNVSSFAAEHKSSVFEQAIVAVLYKLNNHSFYWFTRKTHDFLGINYYFHWRLRHPKYGLIPRFPQMGEVHLENREQSDVGWELYPHGIYDVIMDLANYRLPIFITENGLATTNDDKRVRFIVSYLKEIYHAIQAGAPVKGYFHWSLIDNFEWSRGFTPRFGLVRVDYSSQQRVITPGAEVYAKICRENAIDHELLKFLGHALHLSEFKGRL